MVLRFKGCRRCTGDLVLEDDEWRCLQCGHYYYTGLTHILAGPRGPESALAGATAFQGDEALEAGAVAV
jgi:hypothetical protein